MEKIPILIRMNKQLVCSADLIIDDYKYMARIIIKKDIGKGKDAIINANEKSFLTWIRLCYGTGMCNVTTFVLSAGHFTRKRRRVNKRFWKGFITEDAFKRTRDEIKPGDWVKDESTGESINLHITIPSIITKYLNPCKPVESWHSYDL